MSGWYLFTCRTIGARVGTSWLSSIQKPRLALVALLSVTLPVLAACGKSAATTSGNQSVIDNCALAMTPHSGDAQIDREIARLQEEARRDTGGTRSIDQLGWAFVQKARVSYDPGFYKLAESCALCAFSRAPSDLDALLLRGHVLDSLHRFKEAEAVARELVTRRGLFSDFALLGDALMEQGHLDESVDAYQKMIDLKPGPQAYSRAAHLRWLKGNVKGAVELMRMAAQSGGPGQGESAAWAYTKLAMYALQDGDSRAALEACDEALSLERDYSPALLAKGRALLATGNTAEAIDCLKNAAGLNPLPEYQWALADALRACKRSDEALAVEARLEATGAASDPRTYALYLATRHRQIDRAIALCAGELESRRDVFTLDAVAWSLAAAGRTREAGETIKQALAVGTKDARLFFHAARIAASAGERREARQWFDKAIAMGQTLLPSERDQLSVAVAGL